MLLVFPLFEVDNSNCCDVCIYYRVSGSRIFKGEKILSTPSFGGEVKPSVPFTACKRSLYNYVEVEL
jgi:hypothetical protein